MDLNLNAEINSFNFDRLEESELDLTLSRRLLSRSKDQFSNVKKSNTECFRKNNDKYNSNYSLDIGLYSLYRKEKVYSAFGSKLTSNYDYQKNRLKNNFYNSIDFGEFQAEKKEPPKISRANKIDP